MFSLAPGRLAGSSGVRCAEHNRTPLRPCQRRPGVTENTGRALHSLPPDLPVPSDDGAADHLVGALVPPVALRATSGADVDLASAASGLVVVYVYPRTGEPGQALPGGWDEIPGARGCTVQNCVFRDHAAALRELGALVYGIGAQPLEQQRSFVAREAMPYPLLNDSELQLAEALGLPTFEASGMRLYRRLTFVASLGRIERVVYPVFPPGSDAEIVLAWLRERPRTRTADSRPGSGSRS
jgi:peroxiredoxin